MPHEEDDWSKAKFTMYGNSLDGLTKHGIVEIGRGSDKYFEHNNSALPELLTSISNTGEPKYNVTTLIIDGADANIISVLANCLQDNNCQLVCLQIKFKTTSKSLYAYTSQCIEKLMLSLCHHNCKVKELYLYDAFASFDPSPDNLFLVTEVLNSQYIFNTQFKVAKLFVKFLKQHIFDNLFSLLRTIMTKPSNISCIAVEGFNFPWLKSKILHGIANFAPNISTIEIAECFYDKEDLQWLRRKIPRCYELDLAPVLPLDFNIVLKPSIFKNPIRYYLSLFISNDLPLELQLEIFSYLDPYLHAQEYIYKLANNANEENNELKKLYIFYDFNLNEKIIDLLKIYDLNSYYFKFELEEVKRKIDSLFCANGYGKEIFTVQNNKTLSFILKHKSIFGLEDKEFPNLEKNYERLFDFYAADLSKFRAEYLDKMRSKDSKINTKLSRQIKLAMKRKHLSTEALDAIKEFLNSKKKKFWQQLLCIVNGFCNSKIRAKNTARRNKIAVVNKILLGVKIENLNENEKNIALQGKLGNICKKYNLLEENKHIINTALLHMDVVTNNIATVHSSNDDNEKQNIQTTPLLALTREFKDKDEFPLNVKRLNLMSP